MIKSLEKTDAKKDQPASSATVVREPVVREVKEPAKPAVPKAAGHDSARESALSRAVQQIVK